MRKKRIIIISVGASFVAGVILATSPVGKIPTEKLPVELKVQLRESKVLPAEPLFVDVIYRNKSERHIELVKVEWDGGVRGTDGVWARKAQLRYRNVRQVNLKPKESFYHRYGEAIITWRVDIPVEAGKYKISISKAIGKTGDGKEWLLDVECEAEFEVVEPEGQDREAWKVLRSEIPQGFVLLNYSEEAGKKVIDSWPDSRYIPYILYYDLHDYATFIERYPEHPLAPGAHLKLVQKKMGIGTGVQTIRDWKDHPDKDFRPSEATLKAIEGALSHFDLLDQSVELLKAVVEKYPGTDAAWEAEYGIEVLGAKRELWESGTNEAILEKFRVLTEPERVRGEYFSKSAKVTYDNILEKTGKAKKKR